MAIWEAREASVKISEFLATVASTVFTAQVSATDYSGRVKNVAITGGERDVESIPLLGTTSGYANQEIFQKSVGSLREITMTLVYQDTDISLLGAGTVTKPTTYTRRIQGDQALTKKAVLVSFTDGSNTLSVLMNNCFVTKMGDIKIEADGHAEQEITLKCLAKDYYEEDDI
jgi:hypothetical protein